MESRIKNLKNYEEFRKVFDIFKYYPFFEAWTEDEFYEEFLYLKQMGEIFGCYLDDNEIVGLVSLIYGAKSSHPVKFENPEKVMYISDIAVTDKYRGNGFAKKLADFAIQYTYLLNYYNEMYLRTNLENSMSEKIFVDRGFEVIKNNGVIITEDVSFPRTNPAVNNIDTRKFLSLKLEKH